MTAKDRIVEIMQDLPDEVTFEDAMYELYVAFKIERGLEQAAEGKAYLRKKPSGEYVSGYGNLGNR